MTASADTAAHRSYRPDIDGLRAVSILLVLAYHFLPGRMPGGFIGVDIFFVISGYLITHQIVSSIEAKKFSVAIFYAHRVRRILPALLVVLLTSAVVGAFTMYADQLRELGQQIIAGALFYANILFWRKSGYFDTANREQPFFHLWSLGVEEQFYIFFPIALFLIFRFPSRFRIILGVLVVSFVANVLFVRTHTSTVFYLLPTRAWELMIGAALSLMEGNYGFARLRALIDSSGDDSSGRVWPEILFAASMAVVIFQAFTLNDTKFFPGWYALGPTLAGWSVIAVRRGAIKRMLLENGPMVWIGKISYPLYLWHVPVAYFFWLIYRQSHQVASANVTRLANALIIPAISIILAGATFELLEKPVRKRLSNDVIRRRYPRVLYGAVAALLVLVTTGFALVRSPWISDEEKYLADYYGDAYINTFASLARTGKCLLPAGSPELTFAESCYRPGPAPRGRSILIWGDSHAAALYPGLAKDAKQFDVLQLTSGCPPVMDLQVDEKRSCVERNRRALAIVREVKPEIVILHARWALYSYNEPVEESLRRLARQLKDAGVSQVIVVGPVPSWQPSLYKVLQREYLRRHRPIPTYVAEGLEKPVLELDRTLSRLRDDPDIVYVSAIESLCRANGCLAVLGGHLQTDLLTWDYAHFTDAGSEYFARAVLIPKFHQRPAP